MFHENFSLPAGKLYIISSDIPIIAESCRFFFCFFYKYIAGGLLTKIMAHPAARTGSRRPLYMEPEEWYIHVERMGYYEDLRITENDAFRFSRPCGRNHIYRGLQFPLPLLSQQ